MSPELLDPDRFGTGDCRPTKQSDCYALGMVVYEVRTISGFLVFAMVRLGYVRSFVEMLLSGRLGMNL